MSTMYWINELGRAEAAPGEDVLHLGVIEDEAVVAGYLGHFHEATERGYWSSAEAFTGKDIAACRASHGDDDFSLSVSLFEITDGLGDLAQRVGPIYDRGDLPGFDELLED